MATSLSKRKARTSSLASRKKVKTAHRNADQLPWKTVSTSKEAGITSEFDGILELEEVENVEVVYEETEGGKVAKFKVRFSSITSQCFIHECSIRSWLIPIPQKMRMSLRKVTIQLLKRLHRAPRYLYHR